MTPQQYVQDKAAKSGSSFCTTFSANEPPPRLMITRTFNGGEPSSFGCEPEADRSPIPVASDADQAQSPVRWPVVRAFRFMATPPGAETFMSMCIS